MDAFQSRYYNINKILLFYLGQWPLQNPREQIFFRSTTAILVGSIMLPKIIKFAQYFGDMNGMIQCIPILGLHILSAINFCTCSIKGQQFKDLMCRIKDDWTTQGANFRDTYLKRYAERSRVLTVFYTIYLYMALGLYLLAPGIPILLDIVAPLNQSRDFIHLYETEYFIDQEKYYFVLLFHAYITMPISVGMIIAFDTMFVVYVHHACAIFAILGARLESIGRGTRNVTSEMTDDRIEERDEAYEEIVKCVKMHRDAAEFARLIESATATSFLLVFGMALLMITMTGFMMVTRLDDLGDTLRYSAFAAGEVLHVFYICWQGQLLMDHSENISVNVYNINWYDISPRAKKLLILIMMRSSIPCKVTAGKVYDLSLENFTTVIKTSMSYFTVLLSMK